MASLLEKFPNWTASDRQNTLNARLFNGSITFSVFPRDRNAGRQPLGKFSFDKDGAALQGLLDLIDQIGKAPLGQKMQMSRTQFDPATKTRKTIWVISLGKDSDMCYSITLTDVATNRTFTFPIAVSQSILVGNEPPSKSDLSAKGMRLFKRWLQKAEEFAPLTIDPNAQFGGRGGQGGGGQRPPTSSGYQPQNHVPSAAAVSPSMDADETMPF